MKINIRATVAVLCLGLIAVACSSDPQPDNAASPAATATSAPAPTPTPTPTPIPTSEVADLELASFPDAYREFIAANGGSKFVEVNGSQMHYLDVGDLDGQVILLGHGAPTNAYLWRNIIDALRRPGRRIIAVDLIGFGRSEHPDLDYSFETHSTYLQGFIEALGLQDVNLVLHDISGQAGFGYAAANPDNVNSLASFEVLYRPFVSLDEMGPVVGPLFEQLQTPGVGEAMMIEQNLAVEGNLDLGTATDLDPEIKATYGWFFTDPASRDVNLDFARSTPIGGQPAEAAAFIDGYAAWLAESDVPKLVMQPSAGLVPVVQAETGARLPNTTFVEIAGAGHFAQEDNPDAVSAAINEFYAAIGLP